MQQEIVQVQLLALASFFATVVYRQMCNDARGLVVFAHILVVPLGMCSCLGVFATITAALKLMEKELNVTFNANVEFLQVILVGMHVLYVLQQYRRYRRAVSSMTLGELLGDEEEESD